MYPWELMVPLEGRSWIYLQFSPVSLTQYRLFAAPEAIFSPIVAMPANSHSLRRLSPPVLLLRELREGDLYGCPLVPGGNPFCGWSVDR